MTTVAKPPSSYHAYSIKKIIDESVNQEKNPRIKNKKKFKPELTLISGNQTLGIDSLGGDRKIVDYRKSICQFLDIQQYKLSPCYKTDEAEAEVYSVDFESNTPIIDIFLAFPPGPKKSFLKSQFKMRASFLLTKSLIEDQVINFIEKHKRWLNPQGPTLFLMANTEIVLSVEKKDSNLWGNFIDIKYALVASSCRVVILKPC